jgi:transcriptional regulator with XRE-family HTH domain
MDVSRSWYLALKVLAGLRKLSAKELAKRAKISETSARKYLRGPENLGLETLEKLLGALQVDVLDLALLMSLIERIDRNSSMRLFEIAEPEPPIVGSDAPPEFLRLYAQVQWLYEEMQRQLHGRRYPPPRPPLFSDVTDR